MSVALSLFVELCQVLCNHLVGDGIVLQVTLDEGLVAWHVNQSVTGEVEEDYFLLASLLALLGLADGSSDGVAALRSREQRWRGSSQEQG